MKGAVTAYGNAPQCPNKAGDTMKRGRKARKLVSGFLERIHSNVFSEFPDNPWKCVAHRSDG